MASSVTVLSLGAEAARVAWSLRRRHHLLPSQTLVRWRTFTAYGHDGSIRTDDLVSFLRWRRRVRRQYR